MPHADTTGVRSVIQGATKSIDSVSKLGFRVAKEGGSIPIGDSNTVGGAAAAEEVGVNTIIKGVKKIIEVAEKSGVKINTVNAGADVASGGSSGTAPAIITVNAAGGGIPLKLMQT
ncbi:hypothetical protein [Borrelia hermsii]|uniref:hypothetical protein n=1 Tax=Borrelia hermsii TaxID=140 RepID=UPI001181B224|nr:VlpB-like protein [Borrelia hermsii]